MDYLNSVGQDSSYTNRAKLAAANGISNYTGTAAQNTQLLSILNKPAAVSSPTISSTPVTTKAHNDPSYKYDTLTGQLNPNYVGYVAPVSTPVQNTTSYNNTSSSSPYNSTYTTPISTPLTVPTQTVAPVSSAYNIPGAVNTSTPVTNTVAPSFTQNLEPGMTGNEVKKLQDYLVSAGFMTQAQVNTGYGTYGPQTTAAVAAWQKANGVDTAGYAGYFGPKSIATYNVLKSGGATSSQAAAIAGSTSAPTPNSTGIYNSSLGSAMGVNTPTPTTTFNAYDLTAVTKPGTVKLSSIAPDLVAAGSAGDVNVSSGIAGILALLAANKSDDTEYNEISTKLNNLISNLGDQQADFKEAMEAEGASAYKEQIQQLNLKIAQITGEINSYDAQTSAGLNDISDQAIPTGLLIGQSAAYQRQRDSGRAAKAAELASTAALQQAYSQNYEIAIGLAEASVNYKWSTISTKLSALQVQLGIAKEVMDKEDNKQLNIVNLLLQDQQNQINEKKDTENEINKLLITAAANGAPLTLITSAKKSGSAGNAIVILQEYLGTTSTEAAKTITVKNADGSESVYQWNPETNQYDIPVGSNGSSSNATEVAKVETAIATKTLADSILNSSALNNAVNPNGLASFWDNLFTLDNWNGNTQTFLGQVQQLTSQQTMDTLLNLKKAGGTLGALSDSERQMLQTAATTINAWAILDKNGKVKGYNVSETSFKAEINRIKTLAQKAIDSAGVSSSNSDGWF